MRQLRAHDELLIRSKSVFGNTGVEVIGSSAAELALRIKGEMARLGKVIKDAAIRDE